MTKHLLATQIPFVPRLVKAALVSTCCFSMSNIAFAEDGYYSAGFPYTPGFTLMGLTGSNTTGYADTMLPALGTPISFLYVDPQILFGSNNSYTASLGTGFRYLNETAGILGAYVFADYNHSSNSNGFWFASPGIERLGETVDFSANLYIPISTQTQGVGSAVTGQELGTDNYLTFFQHGQYDATFATLESVGTGADAEIGVRLPLYNNPKLYVGGYYFSPQQASDNIAGATARLEVPITSKFTFLLSDGYDNEEGNTLKVGISYNFGGRRNSKFFTDDLFTNNHFADERFSSNLTERMVDPIHRNLAAISGSSETGQPISIDVVQTNAAVLVQGQIAFFDITAPANGDGTFERPFNVFDQTNVNAANGGSNVNLFVNTGTYNVSPVTLTNDYLYGRQDDANGNPFAQAATDGNRPLFSFSLAGSTPGFTLVGNNSFDSVSLSNTPSGSGTGISIVNANPTMAFSMNNSTVNNFLYGLNISNNTGSSLSVDISDSAFANNTTGLNVATNSGTATINATNSTFNTNTNGLNVDTNTATSILSINATNSTFNNNTANGLNFGVNNGIATINTTGSDFNTNTNGLNIATNNVGGSLSINANDSNFSNNTANGLSFGTNNGTAGINTTGSNFSFNGENGLNVDTNGVGSLLSIATNNSDFINNTANGLNFGNNYGTATINSADSAFNSNATGLNIFANNAGSSFTIITNNSNFNTNTSTGLNFGTNNGTATIDITDSTFNTNGTGLSGTGLNISTNNAGSSFTIITNNSNFNTNTSTGLNFGTNNGTATIDTTDSTFNTNGTGLSGTGLNISTNNAGSSFTITDNNSDFSNNLSTGLNFGTNNAMGTTINLTGSTLNGNKTTGLNVTLNGTSSSLSINTNSASFDNNTIQGLYLGTNNGAATIRATDSTFSENGVGSNLNGVGLSISTNNSGSTLVITSNNSSFNDNTSAGLSLSTNNGSATINTDASFFNGNAVGWLLNNASTSATLVINASNSDFNGNNQDGLLLTNSGTVSAIFSNANFNNNAGSGFFYNNLLNGIGGFSIANSSFSGNASLGLALNSNNGQTMTATINNSVFNNNLGGGFLPFSGGLYVTNTTTSILPSSPTPNIQITATNSSFTGNVGYGVYAANLFFFPGTLTPMTVTLTNSTFSPNNTLGPVVPPVPSPYINWIINPPLPP